MAKETRTTPPVIIPCDDLAETVDFYTRRLGFKLDAIMPADSPTVALLHIKKAHVRLEERRKAPSGPLIPKSKARNPHYPVISRAAEDDLWVTGRARMEYRDLIPGRLGGRMIASHIRLTKGGEVADYVHYHKVKFQMIYCLKGSIRVVYEDQGEPFWLNPGDCVMQPPEIRHRVLECTAGSEVVEIGMPAVHETWVEHEVTLPTSIVSPNRDFGGQRFVRHMAAEAEWTPSEFGGIETRDTGILAAADNLADVLVFRSVSGADLPATYAKERDIVFYFVLKGRVQMISGNNIEQTLGETEAFVVGQNSNVTLSMPKGSELLAVSA
jgi:quercetin dioxygenase-like cupin family protein